MVMADPESSLMHEEAARERTQADDRRLRQGLRVAFVPAQPAAVDAIKIDQEFVMSMPRDEGDALMPNTVRQSVSAPPPAA
jgi:hypothetical protein